MVIFYSFDSLPDGNGIVMGFNGKIIGKSTINGGLNEILMDDSWNFNGIFMEY